MGSRWKGAFLCLFMNSDYSFFSFSYKLYNCDTVLVEKAKNSESSKAVRITDSAGTSLRTDNSKFQRALILGSWVWS